MLEYTQIEGVNKRKQQHNCCEFFAQIYRISFQLFISNRVFFSLVKNKIVENKSERAEEKSAEVETELCENYS